MLCLTLFSAWLWGGVLALGVRHKTSQYEIISAITRAILFPEGFTNSMSTSILIVLNKDEDTVTFIDEPTRNILKIAAVDRNPHEVAVTPDGRKAFVSNAGGNTISVFDMHTLEIVDTIRHPEFNFPHEGKITQDGRLILASTYANKVFVIDTATHAITNIIPAQRMSHMVSLTPDDKFAYVSNIGANSLSVLDLATETWVAHYPTGRSPEGIGISPDGQWAYVANQDDNMVYILDTATHSLQARIRTSDVPIRVAFTPDGKYGLVPNREGDCLSVIDVARKLEIKRIRTGIWPGGTICNAAGTYAYVANNKTNDISVIDLATLKVVDLIDVGIHPDGIGVAVF